MAFPTIPTVGAGRVLTGLSTSLSNPVTLTFPSLSDLTKNAGDVLIAIVTGYGGPNAGNNLSSWGGGFTEFTDQGGTTGIIGAAWKVSDGTETGTFTVSQANVGGHSGMILLSIPGAHNTTAPEMGGFATGTTLAANPSNFNPTGWDAEDTLWIAVGQDGETSTSGTWQGVSIAPANFGDYVDTGLSGDLAGAIEAAVAFRTLNAAELDVGNFTMDTSNTRSVAAVIAVRPAPSATPVDGDPLDLVWDMIAQVNRPALTLKADLAAAANSAADRLVWDTRNPVTGSALTLKADLRAAVNAAALDLVWDLLAQQPEPVDGDPIELTWDLRALVNAAALSLKADLRAQADAAPTDLVWDTRSAIDSAALDLLWDDRAAVDAATTSLLWDLVAQVDAAKSLKWDLAAAVNMAALDLVWDLIAAGAVDGDPMRLVYDLATAVNAAPLTLKSDLRAGVNAAALRLVADLAAATASPSTDLLWDLRSQVDGPVLDLPWDLRSAATGAALRLVWDLAQAVGAVNGDPVSLLWDLAAQTASAADRLVWDLRTPVDRAALTLPWDLRLAVSRAALQLPWDLRAGADASAKRLVWDDLVPVEGASIELVWDLLNAVTSDDLALLWDLIAQVNGLPLRLRWSNQLAQGRPPFGVKIETPRLGRYEP